MDTTDALTQIVNHPAVDKVAEPLSKAVRDAYEAAGPVGQQARMRSTASGLAIRFIRR
jgi:hypothetical protein